MQTNMHETVSCKFDDLIYTLNHFSDDLKIACAEASLDGDFSLVAKLSNESLNTQVFIKDVTNISNHWRRKSQRAGNTNNRAGKKIYTQKKPPTKLCVTIGGKQIQEKTAAETFALVIETMGLERVAKLDKKLSGISLLSKFPSTEYHTQKKSGDWYITTHSSTKNMKIILEEIGKSLRIPVVINIVGKK